MLLIERSWSAVVTRFRLRQLLLLSQDIQDVQRLIDARCLVIGSDRILQIAIELCLLLARSGRRGAVYTRRARTTGRCATR